MKTKAVAALAVIMALVMAACSNNDEPVGPQQTKSIAASYLTPTSMHVPDINSLERKWRNCTTLFLIFQGEETNPETDAPEFERLTRFFGDTACTSGALKAWPSKERCFLSNLVLDIEATAADDSWGADHPAGSDISDMLRLTYKSADKYTKSGYLSRKSIADSNKMMNEWQKSDSYSLSNRLQLVYPDGIHYREPWKCEGHKFNLKVTSQNGVIEQKDVYIYCFATWYSPENWN